MGHDSQDLSVKSREIVWPFVKQRGSFTVPIFQALDGGHMLQCTLRDMLIVELHIAYQGVAQVFAGPEAGGGQHLADTTVESLDHAIGLGVSRLDEAVGDVVPGADLIEGMAPGRRALSGGAEAVGELLAVIGEHRGDRERRGLDQAFEEGAGMVGAFGRQDLDVDPARSAVDGGEEVLAAVLIGHLRQVLHIDVHETRFVVLERLGRRGLGRFAWHQIRQSGHPVAAQAAVQARARDLVVDELMGHGEQVIERQQQQPPQFHHQDLLGRREGGMQGMGPVRGVVDRLARAPLAHRDRAEVVASCEDLGWLGRGLQLTTDRRRGARVFVQVDVHRQRTLRMNGGPRAGVALVAGRDSGRPPGFLRPAPRRAPLEPRGHGREDSSFWVHNHTGRNT